ncbi:MAG: putative transport system permease protein [Blastocatellia bacterium]|nr:putative transport system permease protein [Blastocatellia bacterium]
MITPEEHAVEGSLGSQAAPGAVNHPEKTGSGGGRRSVFWLQGVAFLLGLGLLVYVINRVGMQPVFDALGRIGFGFFLLLAISGLRHVLRTIAMRTAVPPEHRRFTFSQAFAARLGGESISFLTFAGPLLGEATKVALLRKRVPLLHGVPALVVDNLLYNLSVVFFILSGACVMLVSYPLPRVVREILFVIAGCALLGILAAAFAASRRVLVLTWMIDMLVRLGIHPKAITSRRHHIHRIELTVYGFYRRHPRSFLAMLVLDFVSHIASVVEVYLTLKMLGFSPHVGASYVIESLTKVINFVFGFVPATIGVYEGGTEVILQTLGYAAATGVTLAIVRKAGIVFWTVIGLVILTGRALPNAWQRMVDRSPRLRKVMDSLVISNIAHRPARTAVTIAGIAIGVLMIVFTVGLAHGVLHERGRRESNIGAEIMVRASGSVGFGGSQPFVVPVSHAADLAQVEGVRMATPLGQSFDKSDRGFGSRLLDGIIYDEYAALNGLTIREGRKLGAGDEAIVDPEWQNQRQAKVGSTVQIYERPFLIVGIYEPPGGGRVKIPLATLQDQLGAEGRCSSILVACVDPARQEEVAARIQQRFPDDQIVFTRDLEQLYASGVPALNVFLNVVVSVAAAISMLVILLAMYTTVTERTRQIGILKSLGMSRAAIAWAIQKEAMLVSLLGVVAGVALTYITRFAVMRSTSLTVEIEPKWIAVSLAVGLVGGTIGALYPALRAASQDPVEALSYE